MSARRLERRRRRLSLARRGLDCNGEPLATPRDDRALVREASEAHRPPPDDGALVVVRAHAPEPRR